MKAWKAKAILLFGTVIWGATFLFTQIGIEYCSPSFYVVLRFVFAALLCLLFFWRKVISTPRKVIKQGAVLGLFFSCGFLLQTFALKHSSIGNTAFITDLCVVITPFIFWLRLKERVSAYSKVGVIVALVGVWIITQPTTSSLNIGDLLTIASTFFWSLYMVNIHIYTKDNKDPNLSIQLVLFQFLSGLPILLLYFFIFDLPSFYFHFNTSLAISLAFNSIMASFLVSFLQITFQKYTTPVNASIIFSLEPVFASIFAFVVLGEVLSPNTMIGAVFIFAAVFISDTLGELLKMRKNISV